MIVTVEMSTGGSSGLVSHMFNSCAAVDLATRECFSMKIRVQQPHTHTQMSCDQSVTSCQCPLGVDVSIEQ